MLLVIVIRMSVDIDRLRYIVSYDIVVHKCECGSVMVYNVSYCGMCVNMVLMWIYYNILFVIGMCVSVNVDLS